LGISIRIDLFNNIVFLPNDSLLYNEYLT